eukprot:gene11121-7747_t
MSIYLVYTYFFFPFYVSERFFSFCYYYTHSFRTLNGESSSYFQELPYLTYGALRPEDHNYPEPLFFLFSSIHLCTQNTRSASLHPIPFCLPTPYSLMISSTELDAALRAAVEASKAAAQIILRALEEKQAQSVMFEEKASCTDLVTVYDKKCEDVILAHLRNATPPPTPSLPTWVVDPIDATMSFIHGMYDCCVSIALAVNREPVVGVVNAPQVHMLFHARIHVSSTNSLKQALILSHYSSHRTPAAIDSTTAIHRFLNLYPVHTVRCQGSAALDMCLVGCGKADVYFDAGANPWDVAAGIIIVREAGGVVHDVDNMDSHDIRTKGVCCGSSTKLTETIVDLVRRYGYRQAVQNRSRFIYLVYTYFFFPFYVSERMKRPNMPPTTPYTGCPLGDRCPLIVESTHLVHRVLANSEWGK